MEFLASESSYAHDQASRIVWERLAERLGNADGICYYRHPIIASTTRQPVDLTILAANYQPLALRCMSVMLNEIEAVTDEEWTVNGEAIESPLRQLDDYSIGLQHKFDKERPLRKIFSVVTALALPLINRANFEDRFGTLEANVLWADFDVGAILEPVPTRPSEKQWMLAKSVFQGVNPLNKAVIGPPQTSAVMGDAIEILDKDIALLDSEQHKVAIQIAPGPQRVRGLAGTGKTVVLAMKAANIHLRYPTARVLFTFNTQSLYNQARVLIAKFYRAQSETDPDWRVLHVRHGWGGSARPGVYSDFCKRAGLSYLTFPEAARQSPRSPLAACCKHALAAPDTGPVYDYVLVDEAQDFPPEFFKLLYRLTTEEKRIYWAYDELQSLADLEIRSPKDLFGVSGDGQPLVDLDGEYPGGIEKDFVLHRSYRCPREILMLAHGLGLGLHSPSGCVQILKDRASWESIGYTVEAGELQTGHDVAIYRPEENSPNPIREIYTGHSNLVEVQAFDTRDQEIRWVAEAIEKNIKEEHIHPEQIIVICLDSKIYKQILPKLQSELNKRNVRSVIPGLMNESAAFAEPDLVTLSTVFRAKGNEAPIIYIITFEYLHQYVEGVDARNRAFTSISRSKGWVRITGLGKRMQGVVAEISKILTDIPRFRFTFPDLRKLPRTLDETETTRRRRQVRKVKALLDLDPDVLAALDTEDKTKLKRLVASLDEGE